MLLRYTSKGARTAYPPVHVGAPTVPTRVYDLAVTTRGTIVGVGVTSGDRFQCTWSTPTGGVIAATWSTTFSDALFDVAADAFGGCVTAGTVATGEDETAVETRRVPVGTSGGLQWTYQWSGPTAASHSVQGIAVSGGVVAVSGTCRSAASGSDQFIQVWRY